MDRGDSSGGESPHGAISAPELILFVVVTTSPTPRGAPAPRAPPNPPMIYIYEAVNDIYIYVYSISLYKI